MYTNSTNNKFPPFFIFIMQPKQKWEQTLLALAMIQANCHLLRIVGRAEEELQGHMDKSWLKVFERSQLANSAHPVTFH